LTDYGFGRKNTFCNMKNARLSLVFLVLLFLVVLCFTSLMLFHSVITTHPDNTNKLKSFSHHASSITNLVHGTEHNITESNAVEKQLLVKDKELEEKELQENLPSLLESSAANKYFDKIFVINLFDREERWQNMNRSMSIRNIQAERIIAIDGRCQKHGLLACKQKLKSMEMYYNVKIVPTSSNVEDLSVLAAASALSIGTIVLMRAIVKNNWTRILILEDDVDFDVHFENKFRKGIESLKDKQWDMLYLGCGSLCGHKDISKTRSKSNKYESTISQVIQSKEKDKLWVKYKNDLRATCDQDYCSSITKYISNAPSPGGTWGYAVSLNGAKKILKKVEENAGQHMDKLYGYQCKTGVLKCVAFDPPIVWHQHGYFRPTTDIPWHDWREKKKTGT